MRKVIATIHLSLDGYASRHQDPDQPFAALDWISYDSDLEEYAHSLHQAADAVIWGRKTYEGMASYWLTVPGNPESTQPERNHAQWLEDSTKIVVSRTLDHIEWGGAQNSVLIKDQVADEINKLKQQPGKDIWFIGSVNLAQTFIELDLIDEYRFTINPTVLSDGVPLFANITRSFPLKLLEAKTFASGVVALRYVPERK